MHELMKKILLSGAFFALLLAQACTSKQQSEQTSTTETAPVESATSQTAEAALTERLTALGLTTNSHWRGVKLGDSIATVRATEKAALFESDASHLGYTLEFPNLESVDMLYRIGSGQTVNGIDVDLYLNDASSATAYQSELTKYFDARYKSDGTADTWMGEKRETVMLKNVSKGKDYGLKIKFAAAPAI